MRPFLRPTDRGKLAPVGWVAEPAGQWDGKEVVRDQLLGAPRPGESPEDYRLRSYQALATAEELTLADHHLFQPETETETQQTAPGDPDLDRYSRHLDEINGAIHNAP